MIHTEKWACASGVGFRVLFSYPHSGVACSCGAVLGFSCEVFSYRLSSVSSWGDH